MKVPQVISSDSMEKKRSGRMLSVTVNRTKNTEI